MTRRGRERTSNVGLVCAAHAPTAGAYTGVPAAHFVGHFIQLRFQGKDCDGQPVGEHMWVHVAGVDAEGTLFGALANDPLFDHGLEDGSAVIGIQVSDIQAVEPGTECFYCGRSGGALVSMVGQKHAHSACVAEVRDRSERGEPIPADWTGEATRPRSICAHGLSIAAAHRKGLA